VAGRPASFNAASFASTGTIIYKRCRLKLSIPTSPPAVSLPLGMRLKPERQLARLDKRPLAQTAYGSNAPGTLRFMTTLVVRASLMSFS
jgi:hypothetical protein